MIKKGELGRIRIMFATKEIKESIEHRFNNFSITTSSLLTKIESAVVSCVSAEPWIPVPQVCLAV
jgi:hypothetical protein